MRSFFVAFSITAIFTCYAKANPIQNGSFEATGISSGTEVVLTPSSTEITSWSIDDGSGLYYVKDGNPQGIGAMDGSHAVNFGRAGGHGGAISQVFNTVPGTAYEVAYWITQTEWNDDDGQTMSIEAYAGSTSLAPAVSNNLPITQNQWSQGAVYTFTATSGSTKITFRDTTPQAAGSDSSWALDLVEIAPAANPGNLLPFDPKPSSRVHAAAIQPDGKIIIAGWFNTLQTGTAQQITRQRLARLNPDGTLDEAFYPFPDGHIYAVAVLENGQILVGGDFSKFQEGGASSGNPEILRTDLALLNPDGSVDESFNANLSGGWSVLSVLPLADGRIYIGGNFTSVGGMDHARVALLNPDGSPDANFNYQATAEVTNMAVDSQNRVLLGSYQYVRPGSRVARVASDGVLDADFNPSPDWTVHSIHVQADGKVLIGGSFDNIGVNAIENLARINADGSWDESFQPGAGTNVFSVNVLSNLRILATGDFNQFGAPGPTTVYGLASIEESGNHDATFSPLTAGATVFHALPDREGKLLILSNDILQTAQGSRNYMARFQGTPAFDFLSATSSERVEWLRNGGSAEPAYVVFDLSTDQGVTWTRLGTATRAAGGWELTGLDLPGNGKLRARARVNSSTAYYSCSSLLERVEDFTTPLDVPGEANLWLSGQPDGIPAEEVDAAPGQSPVLANISLVPGHDLVFQVFGGTHNGPGPGTTGPDGGDAASHSPENGIGPMTAPLNALVGVFVTGNPTLPVDPFHVPAQPAPSLYLDFSNPDNRSLQVLEPKLFQPFFIGDGLDAGFNTQHFRVPQGATRLFLGSFDAFTNKENSGQFAVIVDQVEPIDLPALPVSTDFTIEPDTTEGSLTFTIQQTSSAAGLTLRVESTLDPNDPHSWTALPTGSAMVRDGDTWELFVDEPPVGNRYFRVVAEATGYTSTSTEYQENGVAVPILIVPPVVIPPAPVPLKLISWWPGENTAWDVVGSRQGLMKNSANEDPYDVGKVGRAFWFDGIDDYVEGSNSSGSLVQDLTIEVWVQPLDDIGEAMIVSKKSNDTDTVSYSLLLRDGRPVFRSVTDGVASELAATGDPLPVAEWTHLAFTEDDEVGRKIYVNGTLVSSVPTVSSRSSTGGPVTIGAFIDDSHPAATPGSPFDGLVDELTLYSRALTSTEIQLIVAAGKSGKERHDPARDFSATANPNLPWLYGWVDGSSSPVPSHLTGGNPNLGGFFPPPAVLENTTSVYGAEPGAHLLFNKSKYDRASFAGYARGMRPSVISLAPRQFAFHPAVGGENDYAVLQWLAPEAGKYVLSATFTGVENSPTSTDVFLYKNETELFTGDVSSFLGDGISTTEELDLSEDDTVTWIVGGGAAAGLDYTGVVASVVKLDDFQPFARPEYLGQGISGFTPPLMNGKTVRFGAVNTDRDDNQNMTAKVQYSATPTVPGSWDDVPGGAMTASGPSSNTFFLFTNSLPVGTFAFRIATTATGPFGPNNEVIEATTFSAPTESFTVLEAGPHHELELDVSSASDPDGVTTHRGDTLTYRVRFRNSGGLVVPITDEVQVMVKIPDGTTATAAGSTPGYTVVKEGGLNFAKWTLTKPLLPVDPEPAFTVPVADSDMLLSDLHNLEVGDLVMLDSDGDLPSPLNESSTYEVFSVTTNQFKLCLPGTTTAIDIINGGTGTHKFERLWQTRTLKLAVADPTTAQETSEHDLDFGDILATVARITDRFHPASFITDSDLEFTTIINPLSLTAGPPVPAVSPLRQGGDLHVDFTVKNEASYSMGNAFLRVQAPAGLTITGGVLGSNPLKPIEDASGAQLLIFETGPLAPGGSQVCRATFRVQYDLKVAELPFFDFDPEEPEPGDDHLDLRRAIEYTHATASTGRPAVTTYEKKAYTKKVKKVIKKPGKKPIIRFVPVTKYRLVPVNYVRNGIEANLEEEFGLEVQEAPDGSPRPRLQMHMTQHGIGQLPEDPSVQMTAHSDGLAPRDGLTVQHRQNQILYQLSYYNVGDEIAEFVRVVVPIPEHTTYASGSAVIRHPSGGDTPVSAPRQIGNLLIFNLDYLEKKNSPSNGDKKSFEFLVNVVPGTAVGTEIVQSGGVVTSRDLSEGTFASDPDDDTTFKPLRAQVVDSANMVYGDPLADSDDAGNHLHTMRFENDGGRDASNVVIEYQISPGTQVDEANFVIPDPVSNRWKKLTGSALPSGRSVTPFTGTPTSGTIRFIAGTVLAGEEGYVQVRLSQHEPTAITSGSGAYDIEGIFTWPDETSGAEPETYLSSEGPEESPKILSKVALSSFFDPDRSRPYAVVQGPLAAEPGALLTYTITYGDHGGGGADQGGVFAHVPPGTELVGATLHRLEPNLSAVVPVPEQIDPEDGTGTATHGPFDGNYYTNNDLGNIDGGVLWRGEIPSASAITVSMTVRVTSTAVNREVIMRVTSFNQGVIRRTASFPTFIVDPNESKENQQQRIYWSQIGASASTTLGTVDSPNPRFATIKDQMGINSVGASVAGADYVQLANSLLLVSIGQNKIVAAGGGNVVANDGAGLIRNDSAGIVAAGGGNIVAAGAGNLVHIDVPGHGRMTAAALFADLPSIVEGGGGNIVAAGGGNLLRRASLIGQDGAGLIGLDGASLIGLDGASVIGTVRGSLTGPLVLVKPNGAEFALNGEARALVTARVVANDGAGAIAKNAAAIVAGGGGNLIGLQTLNFMPRGNIVAGGGGNIVAGGGGNIVAGGGGNIVAGGGGNIVAGGGGNIGIVRGSTGIVAGGRGN